MYEVRYLDDPGILSVLVHTETNTALLISEHESVCYDLCYALNSGNAKFTKTILEQL